MSNWEALRLALWLFMTQRNGQGPRRFLGLILIEWLMLLGSAAAALLGYWLLFCVSMRVVCWVQG